MRAWLAALLVAAALAAGARAQVTPITSGVAVSGSVAQGSIVRYSLAAGVTGAVRRRVHWHGVRLRTRI
jgi:hypothetical protein